MVQSIWLKFKPLSEEDVNKIKQTIAENWHVTCFKDTTLKNTDDIEIWDTNSLIKILAKIIPITHEMHYHSTKIGRILKFTHNLEFNYGKIDDNISYNYFRLGRNIWGSVGYDIFYERLFLLHRILKRIQKQLKKVGIESRLSVNDVEKDKLLIRNWRK